MRAAERQFNIPNQTISLWCRKNNNYRSAETRPKTGRPRKTSTTHDKMMFSEAVKKTRLTATQIVKNFNKFNKKKNKQTFNRLLFKKPLISKKNRIARLKFSKSHLD